MMNEAVMPVPPISSLVLIAYSLQIFNASTVSSPPHPVTFEFREVQNVIANLNPKKAPGIDGISNKMLIELPRVAVRILLFIFNAMLRLEYFPNNWKVAVVKMIPKPGKDLTKAESYRPISLLPTMSKLFENYL
ncbi:Probable RNA-directed DNA polymerase from transposon X-element [Eumeta japonica]|uniref:Probable RNA-directed DNA polymerase from transposon X-element n=1 Tax=Eumeta variegata TaxID=151549 RepID=A0A4C1S8U2_EUMVA|nr:Probable RNA-directed DNA polymerase from transposon X-element [Eumeta japonica]